MLGKLFGRAKPAAADDEAWIEQVLAYLRGALPPDYAVLESLLDQEEKGEGDFATLLGETPFVLPQEPVRQACVIFALAFGVRLGQTDQERLIRAAVKAFTLVPLGSDVTPDHFDQAFDQAMAAFARVTEVRGGRNEPLPVLEELWAADEQWPAVALMAQVEAGDFLEALRAGTWQHPSEDSFARSVLQGFALPAARARALLTGVPTADYVATLKRAAQPRPPTGGAA